RLMQCNIKLINSPSPLRWNSPYPRPHHSLAANRSGTLSRPSTLPFWHPCDGDYVMDCNNRIGRRDRFEILKIAQGLSAGVVAVDKGQLRPLRPNAILGALEESITRRNREGRIWPAFLDQFWCWNVPFCGNHHVRAQGRTRARTRA